MRRGRQHAHSCTASSASTVTIAGRNDPLPPGQRCDGEYGARHRIAQMVGRRAKASRDTPQAHRLRVAPACEPAGSGPDLEVVGGLVLAGGAGYLSPGVLVCAGAPEDRHLES
jgi:hypothetical protein